MNKSAREAWAANDKRKGLPKDSAYKTLGALEMAMLAFIEEHGKVSNMMLYEKFPSELTRPAGEGKKGHRDGLKSRLDSIRKYLRIEGMAIPTPKKEDDGKATIRWYRVTNEFYSLMMNTLVKAVGGRSRLCIQKDRDIIKLRATDAETDQFESLAFPIYQARCYLARALKIAKDLGLDVEQAYADAGRPSDEELRVTDLNAKRGFNNWMDDYEAVHMPDPEDEE